MAEENKKLGDFAVVFIGNSGVGKTFLLTRLSKTVSFIHRPSAFSVTKEFEYVSIPLNDNLKVSLINIPGLLEVQKQNIERNKRELKRGLTGFLQYKLMFVFGTVGGRIQEKDLVAYKLFLDAYDLTVEQVPIIVNNVPENIDVEYQAEVMTILLEFVRVQPTVYLIKHNDDDMYIFNMLSEAFYKLNWQVVTEAHELNLNSESEAILMLLDQVRSLQVLIASLKLDYETRISTLESAKEDEIKRIRDSKEEEINKIKEAMSETKRAEVERIKNELDLAKVRAKEINDEMDAINKQGKWNKFWGATKELAGSIISKCSIS
jgi:GTPase SAR1 family protein